MKLYISSHAPNPRRVSMFILEKGITGIETEMVDILAGEQRSERFLGKNPLWRVPALEFDDGRVLSETRAICTYLEGLHPEPNLMGLDFEERAFIEMADRRMELHLLLETAHSARHTHPALAPLEQPQFQDYGAAQADKMRITARWLDGVLGRQSHVAGERFTIADITAFCALEFGRGLLRFRPGDEGMANLQAWRDRVAARPSAMASR